MGGIAASGGYYVSMAVGSTPDTVFAEPTTWTGSIGVIIPHYEATGASGQDRCPGRFRPQATVQGDGHDHPPHDPQEEREIFAALVKESFEQFKDVIRSGRPKFQKDPKALDDLATGQVYSADQALQNGLVDKIGYLEDAVDRAIELAGLPPEQVQCGPVPARVLAGGVLAGGPGEGPNPRRRGPGGPDRPPSLLLVEFLAAAGLQRGLGRRLSGQPVWSPGHCFGFRVRFALRAGSCRRRRSSRAALARADRSPVAQTRSGSEARAARGVSPETRCPAYPPERGPLVQLPVDVHPQQFLGNLLPGESCSSLSSLTLNSFSKNCANSSSPTAAKWAPVPRAAH